MQLEYAGAKMPFIFHLEGVTSLPIPSRPYEAYLAEENEAACADHSHNAINVLLSGYVSVEFLHSDT